MKRRNNESPILKDGGFLFFPIPVAGMQNMDTMEKSCKLIDNTMELKLIEAIIRTSSV